MDTRTSVPAEAGDSLALAVIASSNTPLLLLDGDSGVVAASDSFCDAFDIDPRPVAGRRRWPSLGAGEWNVPSSHPAEGDRGRGRRDRRL